MTLAGKTAIVTGASGGIGEATARLLADRGCNVVLAALIGRTIERFGALDTLVNNAGLGLYGSVADGDPKDWRTMFDVKMPFPRHKIA